MPLIGALYNHQAKLERLIELRDRLLARAGDRASSAAPGRRRNGTLVTAIQQIMAEAGRAMKIAEVQVLAEEKLGGRVSRDSVNSCLSTGSEFLRVRRGWYRMAG